MGSGFKNLGKVYNVGKKEYVEVSMVGIKYSTDGAKCIAEVGVLIERGEIDAIPKEAIDE